MNTPYLGKDIRIEAGPVNTGPTVSVCVRKGWWRQTEAWTQVDVRDIEIDVRFDGDCHSPFGVHSIQDLGIDQRQLSHVLGRGRGDLEGAQNIRLDAHTVNGAKWCLNEARQEIASSSLPLVYPFTSILFVGATPQPFFQTRSRGPYAALVLGDFPWPAEKLAEVIGVPFVPGIMSDVQGQDESVVNFSGLPKDLMTTDFAGKDLRIEGWPPAVWVCIRTGRRPQTEEWKRVDVNEIDINVDYDRSVRCTLGTFSTTDLGIAHRELSHRLGVNRFDRTGAELIQNYCHSIRGEFYRINPYLMEISSESRLIYPFSSVEYVGLTPKLHFQTRSRHEYSAISFGSFPYPPEKIAELIGVPLVP